MNLFNMVRFLMLWIICLMFVGCLEQFPKEVVSYQTIEVGEFLIEEEITKSDGWPDWIYERSYWVTYENRKRVLGSYQNESSVGLITDPFVIDEQLILFSGSRLIIWRPGSEPAQYFPFSAPEWADFGREMNINGVYDYYPARAWQEGDELWFEYSCQANCSPSKPGKILFALTTNEAGDSAFNLKR